MSRIRQKEKGRRDRSTHTGIPHAVQDSPNFKRLSGSAIKLLLAIARAYNGFNNGDLCAAYSVLRTRGIRSKDTLHRALLELLHFNMIELTRQGGRHAPSLYALTWHAIDDCKGKLHVAATRVASGAWKIEREPFGRSGKNQNAASLSVPMCPGIRVNGMKFAA